MSNLYVLEGVGGLLEVQEGKLTITPKGIMGFATKGLKGTKTIPLASITAIQFKVATAFFNGYLQFTIPGGNESKGGIFDAVSDENSFMFRQSVNEKAKQIKIHIEAEILKLRSPQSKPQERNLSDELRKLAELRSQGILSDVEFISAKKKLLG